MRITESKGFRATTLFCSGVLDDSTSMQLQNDIFRAAKKQSNIVLDFSDIESCTKDSVETIMKGARFVWGRRGTFIIQNANSKVKPVFQKEGGGRMLGY